MSITIQPKNLTVPEEPFYPIDRLFLFDRFDRPRWERTFGQQAPPFDPSRPRKPWADTSALAGEKGPGALVEYTYFDAGSREFRTMTLPAREAATPNLPGRYIYPEYVIAPTPAVIVNPDGVEDSLSPRMLCHRAEAEELARELGAQSVVESAFSAAGPFRIDWRGEQRRTWMIRLGDSLFGAALLLQRKYRDGVGAPGEWTAGAGNQPVWITRQPETGERDARPEVPIPCRPLAANEALYLDHPMKVIVYRTDRDSEYNRETPGAAAFPPDVRTLLERIDANLQHLLAIQLARE